MSPCTKRERERERERETETERERERDCCKGSKRRKNVMLRSNNVAVETSKKFQKGEVLTGKYL
jgi:hypothetical protein